jgi:acyl carrier protein
VSTSTTFEQVRVFLSEQIRVSPQQIEPTTRLLHDLGIDGDDADEVLSDFGKRFGVDFSALAFQRHFGSELGVGGRWLIRKICGGNAIRLSPVTVQDLVDAANRGRWIEHEKHEV